MARNKYDVDEILEDKFDWNQLKRLATYISPYKKAWAIVLFLMLSSSALAMLIPQFMMHVMDDCIPEKNMKGIFGYAGLTLVIALYAAGSLRYNWTKYYSSDPLGHFLPLAGTAFFLLR